MEGINDGAYGGLRFRWRRAKVKDDEEQIDGENEEDGTLITAQHIPDDLWVV